MTEHHIIPVEPKPGESLDDFSKRLFDELGPGYRPIRVSGVLLEVTDQRDVAVVVTSKGMATILRPRSLGLVSGLPGDVYAQRELAMLLYAAGLEGLEVLLYDTKAIVDPNVKKGGLSGDFVVDLTPPRLPTNCGIGEPLTLTQTKTLQLYVIDDGAKHWFLAESKDDARALYQTRYDIPGGDAGDVEISLVSEEAARKTRFIDEDAEHVPTLYDACVRDVRRRFVGSTEW